MREAPSNLYRFTKAKWAKQFVAEGVVTFGHINSYLVKELTDDQKDDERRRSFSPPPSDLSAVFEMLRRETIKMGGDGELRDPRLHFCLTDDKGRPLDYLLLCCSTAFRPQMYAEFEADTCIWIKDVPQFLQRLEDAVVKQLPQFVPQGAYIAYYDSKAAPPPHCSWLQKLFMKEAKYAHQSEFRLTLIPREGQYDQPRAHLYVGPLSDICEVQARWKQRLPFWLQKWLQRGLELVKR